MYRCDLMPLTRKIRTTGGSYLITLPKDWVENNGMGKGDSVFIDVTDVLTIRPAKNYGKIPIKEKMEDRIEIDSKLKEKIIQILQAVGEINPKILAEEKLSLSSYKDILPILKELLQENVIRFTGKSKSFRHNTKFEMIDKEVSVKDKITYDLFLDNLVEETEKWIDVNNPHKSIASIPAIREIMCSKLNLSEEVFNDTLYEFHNLGIVWLSAGLNSGFIGKPIKMKLGDKMYAFKIYQKKVPSTHIRRVLKRS